MNDKISRRYVKNEIYAQIAEHPSKTTYDSGVRDGLTLAFNIAMNAPDAEDESEGDNGT